MFVGENSGNLPLPYICYVVQPVQLYDALNSVGISILENSLTCKCTLVINYWLFYVNGSKLFGVKNMYSLRIFKRIASMTQLASSGILQKCGQDLFISCGFPISYFSKLLITFTVHSE